MSDFFLIIIPFMFLAFIVIYAALLRAIWKALIVLRRTGINNQDKWLAASTWLPWAAETKGHFRIIYALTVLISLWGIAGEL